MQRCMGGLVSESLLIYLDDVVVYSSDYDTHILHLELWKAVSPWPEAPPQMQPVPGKVTYRGHVISRDRISRHPAKTAAVKDWAAPTIIKQVWSFLGFVGYYSRFVKGYSKIASALNSHLVGTASVQKREDCSGGSPNFCPTLIFQSHSTSTLMLAWEVWRLY